MGTEEKLKCCSCGRNQKTRVKSCSSTRCPCVAAEQKCTAGCKCIGCVNRIVAAKDFVCRCGEGKKSNSTFTSCHDKPGQRKSISVLAFHKVKLVPINVVVSTAKTILVREMRSLSEKDGRKRLHQVHQVVKENHAMSTLTVQEQQWNLEVGQKWKHVF